MRIFTALLFSSVVLAPALALAQSTATPAAAIAPPAAAAPAASDSAAVNLDEIVCRNTPPATGTRLGGGRECHTVRQWNEREQQAQDILRQQQSVGMALSGH